jgi:hypothetical protein
MMPGHWLSLPAACAGCSEESTGISSPERREAHSPSSIIVRKLLGRGAYGEAAVVLTAVQIVSFLAKLAAGVHGHENAWPAFRPAGRARAGRLLRLRSPFAAYLRLRRTTPSVTCPCTSSFCEADSV